MAHPRQSSWPCGPWLSRSGQLLALQPLPAVQLSVPASVAWWHESHMWVVPQQNHEATEQQ